MTTEGARPADVTAAEPRTETARVAARPSAGADAAAVGDTAAIDLAAAQPPAAAAVAVASVESRLGHLGLGSEEDHKVSVAGDTEGWRRGDGQLEDEAAAASKDSGDRHFREKAFATAVDAYSQCLSRSPHW